MATTKPRATITFPPNLYHTLHRFAELQGISLSTMVVSILETAHMPIMRTVSLLEAAQDAPREIREGLRAALDGIAREIEKEAKRDYSQLDFTWGGISKGAGEGAPPRRSGAPSTAPKKGAKTGSNPRPSNTGVRSTKTPPRKSAKTTPKTPKKTPQGMGASKRKRA